MRVQRVQMPLSFAQVHCQLNFEKKWIGNMRLNERSSGIPSELIGQVKAGGEPLVARVDEILGPDSIRATLLVGTLGLKANQSVVLRTAQGTPNYRSLTSAIAGSERIAKLVPADIVSFENAYKFNGSIFTETMSARTHDMMRGKVQVVTAMARPTKSLVNAKGALQSLVITDGRGAKTARSIDKVKDFFAWVRSQPWPGGAPGMIIRDQNGQITKEFFAEGRSTIDSLVEDLEYEDIFATADAMIEMIPAWRLPMGRDQVTRDVDPKVETAAQIGPFTRRFVSKETKGFPGFLPCLVVLCQEDQWEFGGNTGRRAMVAAGVQPLDKLPPIVRERIATSVRSFKSSPNGINRLYDEDTMTAMAKERIERCPDAKPATATAATGSRAPARNFGAFRPSQKPAERSESPPAPVTSRGARRFGR